MKEYMKPEAEFVTLVAQEPITNDDDNVADGMLGLGSSDFD